MDSARRLALRLHALHGDDRAWLLDQIDVESQRRLGMLLQEIGDIGLVPDPEMLAFTVGDMANAEVAESTMRIGMASGDLACQVLRNEPMAVRRYVLNAQRWPWLSEVNQEQMLAIQGGTDRSKQILPLAPRAHQALLQAFSDHLAKTEPLPERLVAPSRPTLLQRIRRGGKWPR